MEKAHVFVSQLTLEEKAQMVTGTYHLDKR